MTPVAVFNDKPVGNDVPLLTANVCLPWQDGGIPVMVGVATSGTPTLPCTVLSIEPFEFHDVLMTSTVSAEHREGPPPPPSPPPPQHASTNVSSAPDRGSRNADSLRTTIDIAAP